MSRKIEQIIKRSRAVRIIGHKNNIISLAIKLKLK